MELIFFYHKMKLFSHSNMKKTKKTDYHKFVIFLWHLEIGFDSRQNSLQKNLYYFPLFSIRNGTADSGPNY